jgi:hypothetical protein
MNVRCDDCLSPELLEMRCVEGETNGVPVFTLTDKVSAVVERDGDKCLILSGSWEPEI